MFKLARKFIPALAEIDALNAENDRLLSLLSKPELLKIVIEEAINLTSSDVSMKHWASKLMVASFADSFNDAGAINFVELSLGDDSWGHFIVTIQKRWKKSPGEMLAEMKLLASEMLDELKSLAPDDSDTCFQETLELIERANLLLNPTTIQD